MAPFLALAGFMGSGKSSVGALSARLLGWRFVDLDDEIAKSAGMTIAQFFELHGERAFRLREGEILRELLLQSQQHGGGEGLVLALGGGTLQDRQTARILEERGGVVLLDIDPERAWERACGDTRPLAQDRAAFTALLDARRPTYEQTADWIVPVGDRTTEEIAAEIAAVVRAAGQNWPNTWGVQLISTERRSTVVGGRGCLASLDKRAVEVAAKGARLFVMTDTNVDHAWGEAVRGRLGPLGKGERTLAVAAGEQSKTVGGLERCWDWLASQGARRDDIIVALGGGVVGDLAGLAAATYQRGVGLWQIPTSLVAQVDSSIGGKTAVNLEAGKNLVGAFYQPGLVLIDPDTLATLPAAEFTNGLGEVVKYGLLSGETLLGTLEEQRGLLRDRDKSLMSDVVKTCVRYKAAVVEEDELDTGRRAVLNLGHTAAHALEVILGFGSIRHGEAVGLGLLVALAISESLLDLDREVRRRTGALLADLGLPTRLDLPPTGAINAAAARDKKVSAASSGFVGLRAPGEPVWGLDLPDGLFERALEVIRA
jgi:shikimate kinase / 3-dehydroquinate synthase